MNGRGWGNIASLAFIDYLMGCGVEFLILMTF